MSYLKAQQLLFLAANYSQREKTLYSRREISQKINEIKYLASQHKVPKLSLRKQIIHLENKLKSIDDFEKRKVRQKQYESTKITALKKEIITLRRKLAATQDRNIQKKIDKLSFLLGECLATKQIKKDVFLSQRVMNEIKKPAPLSEQEKIKVLHEKLQSLKERIVSTSPEKAAKLQQTIFLLEQKLEQYAKKYPQLSGEFIPSLETAQKQHTLLFETSALPEEKTKEEDLESEKELPLPPPPKMRKS